MKYLFGDSTPFPMEENFLETACAASEAAVALLRADEVRVVERRMVAEADERAKAELAHFDAFARRAVETYGQPHDELRGHMGRAARAMLGEMREEIAKWREMAFTAALETAALTRVIPTIGRLFEKHQLPGTQWSVAWGARLDGTGTTIAQVYAQAPGGLDVSLDVAIPASHAWSKPQRVSVVDHGVSIHLVKKRVLRKARVELEALDALFITEVIDLPGEWAMTLRKSQKKPSAGLRVVFSGEGGQEVQVSRIAEDGARTSEPELMRPDDAGVLRRLFAKVGGALRSLVPHRSKIRAAHFRDVNVTELEQPADIGQLIVESVAPYVREIARRSNGRDELALKRTLGDGRREELFVPYATVLAGVENLEPAHRALFDAYGFGARAPASVRALPAPAPTPRLIAPAIAEPPLLAAQNARHSSTPPAPGAFPPPQPASFPPPKAPSVPPPAATASPATSPSSPTPLPPPQPPPAKLPPARLPPARSPAMRPPPRPPMPSDALATQERPVFRLAN